MRTIGGIEIREWEYVYPEGPVYVSFIKKSDIPEELREGFEEWMKGQEYPIIPGHEDAVYSWDWERYFVVKERENQ